jgi:chromosome partitioning protein
LVIACGNQKGGVGKTSNVVGVASALDRRGLRVLCVDMDPQADLSIWLGLDVLDPDLATVNDVVFSDAKGAALGMDAVRKAAWGEHLHCLGSTLDLADRETDLSPGAEFRLAKALVGCEERFDVVLIDCPPSVGRLVVMAMVAATHLLVVTEPAAASLRGVARVLRTMEVVQEHYNHQLRLAGIVVNGEKRTNEAALRIHEVVEAYGSAVWRPFVPARAVVAAASGALAPVDAYGADSREVTAAYEALAERIASLTVGA